MFFHFQDKLKIENQGLLSDVREDRDDVQHADEFERRQKRSLNDEFQKSFSIDDVSSRQKRSSSDDDKNVVVLEDDPFPDVDKKNANKSANQQFLGKSKNLTLLHFHFFVIKPLKNEAVLLAN